MFDGERIKYTVHLMTPSSNDGDGVIMMNFSNSCPISNFTLIPHLCQIFYTYFDICKDNGWD